MEKNVCMVLAGVMLFSTGVVTQAAPVQTAEINSIEGLDQYLSKNQDGTIRLDESAAQDAGYTQEAIAYVQGKHFLYERYGQDERRIYR